MSYVTLAAQFHEKLVTKIQDHLIINHNDEQIEFNEKTSCYIDEGFDDSTHVILTGIDSKLNCVGNYYHDGDGVDFTLDELSIMELCVIMDYLLEGQFKVLHEE